MRATDELGASNEAEVTVIVEDVDPIADAGGPYIANQGVPITFDGSRSKSGAQDASADPITEYLWKWDDGTPDTSGANESAPTHTFSEHGVYNVTLRVTDEEPTSFNEQVVRVEVRDVDPVIHQVTFPQPPNMFEIQPMEFQLFADPGAPGDAITRIEWDMGEPLGNGDTQKYAGAAAFVVNHRFETAGTYTVTIRVSDKDSDSVDARVVTVAEITLEQLLEYFESKLDDIPDALALPKRLLTNALAMPFGVKHMDGVGIPF